MDIYFLTGRLVEPKNKVIVRDDHLGCQLHADLVEPVRELQQKATNDEQCLEVASGYRDFSRQLTIWNEKVSGKRTIFDSQGQALNTEALSEWEIIQAILRWSALPGASRHHWGTDLDVYNPRCLPDGYQLQLTVDEYEHGKLQPFNQWLSNVVQTPECLFYRPYYRPESFTRNDGVAPEPWHLSYRPLAQNFQQQLSPQVLAEALEQADMSLKSSVLEHLDEIFDRFVRVD